MRRVWQRARMRRFSLILLLVLGCPSSPPPQETTPDPEPEPGIALDGQALYEPPLESAPESVRTAWSTFEAAWASEPPMPSDEPSVEEYRVFATEQLAPYADAQVTTAIQLIRLGESAAGPAERLVHSVLAARLLHRGASWLWTLPLPIEAETNPAAREALERSMRGAAQNLAEYAHEAFAHCVDAAATTPAFEPWRADCSRRSESLEPILSVQFGPPPPTPMPEGCEDHTDPTFSSPQFVLESPVRLLVLVEAESDSVDTSAIQRAVERWARSQYRLQLVPPGRRRAAERLVEAGKTSRRGPQCAAPPTLTWVLGLQMENLLVARVVHSCEDDPRVLDLIDQARGANGEPSRDSPLCGLTVDWHRAGSFHSAGLPERVAAKIGPEPDESAVAEALVDDEGGAATQMSRMMTGPRATVAAVEANPGYPLRTAMKALDLHACQTERGTSRLQLAWTVTPTGAVESVTVEGGDDAVNACVKAKLEQLTLTCTPDGQPIPMQTTLCLAN